MLKAKKPKPIYNNITFDSQEEIEFYKWCEVLKGKGYIESIVYHPEPLVLSERKTTRELSNGKPKDVFLLGKHEYTPDFILKVNTNIFYTMICNSELKASNNSKEPYEQGLIWIDVKGSFNKFGGDRGFSSNQKWVHDKYLIYVNKVLTNDKKTKGRITTKSIFRKTFVPINVAYGKRGEILKRFEGCKIGI